LVLESLISKHLSAFPITFVADHKTHYPTNHLTKAVTVVAPGLNIRPSAMMAIIKVLNDLGSDAFLVNFSDIHPRDGDPAAWENDFLERYDAARLVADQHKVPLHFIGYSLGALLGQYLLSSGKDNMRFDKEILLAPATAMKLPTPLKSAVSFLNGNMKIMSFAPKEYRLYDWLPAKIYKTMIRWEQSILMVGFGNLNIPTLIFIDPKDELISFKKIRKQIEQFELTNYQCIPLESNLSHRATRFHHLIIDEATMGNQNWRDFETRLATFLVNP